MSNEVVGFADEHGLVRVVVAEAEALVGVAPREVPVGIPGHQDLEIERGTNIFCLKYSSNYLWKSASSVVDIADTRTRTYE